MAARPPVDEASELRELLTRETAARQAAEAENSRLVAQIEQYAEDLGNLYQERHGRGRGGLTAELQSTKAELADTAAEKETLGSLYQQKAEETQALSDQLVTYGQDLARAYKKGKAAAATPPVSVWQRMGAIGMIVSSLGVVGGGAAAAWPQIIGSGVVDEGPSYGPFLDPAVPLPGSTEGGVRVISGFSPGPVFGTGPDAAAVAATMAAGGSSTGATLSPTGATPQAGAAALALLGTAISATGTPVPTLPAGGAPAATITALAGTVTSLSAQSTAIAARVSGAPAVTPAAATRPPGATGTVLPNAAPLPTQPLTGPTITALAGTVTVLAAQSTVSAATATAYSQAVMTASAGLTATAVRRASTPRPTQAAANVTPLRPPSDDLQRCAYEVLVPPLPPGTGYVVEFTQAAAADVVVLWSYREGTVTLYRGSVGQSGLGSVVQAGDAPGSRGDVISAEQPAGIYRAHLQNRAELESAPTRVAVFYDDERRDCEEPTGRPDGATVTAPTSVPQPSPTPAAIPSPTLALVLPTSTSSPIPVQPYVDCRPYVRGPFGYFELDPRVWMDGQRRTQPGSWPITVTLRGPGTNVSASYVVRPDAEPRRFPLGGLGMYQLRVTATPGAELDPNCNGDFAHEQIN